MSGESELIQAHLPCPSEECGSSDAFSLYDDGHGYCHSCQTDFQPRKLASLGYEVDPDALASDKSFKKRKPGMSSDPKVQAVLQHLIETSTVRDLPKRSISQATCAHWDYRCRINPFGEGEQIAIYRDDTGTPVAAKVRNLGKDGLSKEFSWRPNLKQDEVSTPEVGLYGLHALSSGKMLIVTEGEIDCLTASQLWANKFPVVSVPNGAANAKKDIAKHLEKLARYDKVVFAFDMDEPGRKAAEECARLLRPGQAHIAQLPDKDINAVHLKGADGDRALTGLLHNAPEYRPDGIVSADDLDARVLDPVEWGLSCPFPEITDWTKGKRPGDQWAIGSGTGMGKSDMVAEFVAHDIMPLEDGGNFVPVALFNYESGPVRTYRIILGKQASKRFNIPDPKDGSPNTYWSHDELREASAYRSGKCAQLFINDHKGAIDWDSVKERIRYLVHAHGVRVAYVDPMAALAAGMDDERKALDLLMAEGKQLAEQLGITLIWCSHLTRPKDGPSHEEGGRATLGQFRGSNAIGMWCSYVFGWEGDQQAEEEEDRKKRILRCLKDRDFGDATGATMVFTYNVLTGRQEVVESSFGGEGLRSSPQQDDTPAEADPADLADFS